MERNQQPEQRASKNILTDSIKEFQVYYEQQKSLINEKIGQKENDFMGTIKCEIENMKKFQDLYDQLVSQGQYLNFIIQQSADNDNIEILSKNLEQHNINTSLFQNLEQLRIKQKKLGQLVKKKAISLEQNIQTNLKLFNEVYQMKYKLKTKQNQLENIRKLKQNQQNFILHNKFEISIIKLQDSKTIYRYIRRQSQGTFKSKFKQQSESFHMQINLHQLKTFILASLYPMSSSIFKDFSHQSIIFKVMFIPDTLKVYEQWQYSQHLNRRIQKHIKQTKQYQSMKDCLKRNVQMRKKKIIFIGSKFQFREVIINLIVDLNGFKNSLLIISETKFSFQSSRFEQTNFFFSVMEISYTYKNIKSTAFFDILCCDPSMVKKQDIQYLRAESQENQQVLVWFQIPRLQLGQYQQSKTLKQIDSLLGKIKSFRYSKKAKKEPQK